MQPFLAGIWKPFVFSSFLWYHHHTPLGKLRLPPQEAWPIASHSSSVLSSPRRPIIKSGIGYKNDTQPYARHYRLSSTAMDDSSWGAPPSYYDFDAPSSFDDDFYVADYPCEDGTTTQDLVTRFPTSSVFGIMVRPTTYRPIDLEWDVPHAHFLYPEELPMEASLHYIQVHDSRLSTDQQRKKMESFVLHHLRSKGCIDYVCSPDTHFDKIPFLYNKHGFRTVPFPNRLFFFKLK